MKTTKIFLDTEFTGLHRNSTLISIGLVADSGEEFYAEFNDYDKRQHSPWLEEHVISKLQFKGDDCFLESDRSYSLKANKQRVAIELTAWLQQFGAIEIWADVLAYDWVLFCELFGGVLQLPENIFYAPFDLATLFRIRGIIEPIAKHEKDISRFDFVGADKSKQHHALEDARVEKICWDKLMKHSD